MDAEAHALYRDTYHALRPSKPDAAFHPRGFPTLYANPWDRPEDRAHPKDDQKYRTIHAILGSGNRKEDS